MPTPNYRITLSFDRDRKVFIARAPELQHCSGEGATRAEAIARLEEEIEAQVQNIHAHGGQPPTSVDEEELAGEIKLKVSQGLHRDLLWQARSEGVEVDHLVGEMLAAAVEARRSARSRGANGNRGQNDQPHDNVGNVGGNDRNAGGRNRQGYGPRYHNILDDRANFIEYVRNLDQGQNAAGPGMGGGGPGRGRRRRRGGGPQGGPGSNNGNGGGNGGGNGPNRV